VLGYAHSSFLDNGQGGMLDGTLEQFHARGVMGKREDLIRRMAERPPIIQTMLGRRQVLQMLT
jgi:hypothetical protein